MPTALNGKASRRLRTEFNVNIFDPYQKFTEETFAAIVLVAEEAEGSNPGGLEAVLERPVAELAAKATAIIVASAPPKAEEGKPSATPGFVSGQS